LEPDNDHDQSLHGPSFLGLSDEPDLGSNYLLDDEHASSHWGMYLFLLVLAAGAFLAWRQVRNGGLNRSRLAALVQDVRGKISEQKQEAAAVAPNSNPAAAENSGVANSPTPTPAADTSVAPAGSASNGAPAAQPPSASEIQSAAQKQKVPTPPAALAETAALVKPPSPAAKPKASSRASEPVDDSRATDAENTSLLASAQKYLYGQGVPQSCDRALSFLRQAVDNGSVKAKSTLGGLYATGHCVPLDRAISYRWFAQALRQEPNNSYLSHDLEMLWNQMSPQEKQLAIRMTQ
jgi:hypothetical protein